MFSEGKKNKNSRRLEEDGEKNLTRDLIYYLKVFNTF
jgi:hypothetical protein